eukprot:PhF_6_TR39674/c0_g1_i1/m.58917
MSEEYAKGPKMQTLVEDVIKFLVEKKPSNDREAFLALQRYLDEHDPQGEEGDATEENPTSPRGAWRRQIDTKLQEAPFVQGTHELHTPTRSPPKLGGDSAFGGGDRDEMSNAGDSMRLDGTFSSAPVFEDLSGDGAPKGSPLDNTGTFQVGISCLGREKTRTHETVSIQHLSSNDYVTSAQPPYPLRLPDTSLARADAMLVQDYVKKADGPLGPRFKASRGTDGLPLSVKLLNTPHCADDHPYFLHEMFAVILASRHDNIVNHFDCWMDDDDSSSMKYTQEYLDEEPTTAQEYFTTKAPPEKHYYSYLFQILLALRHLHYHGVTHGNIVATNVFVVADPDLGNGGLVVKIGDFLVPRKYFDPRSWEIYQKEIQHYATDPFTYDVFMAAKTVLDFLKARPDHPKSDAMTSFITLLENTIARPKPTFLGDLLLFTAKQMEQGITDDNVPLISFREDGVVSKYSSGAQNIFGYSADEVIGIKKLYDLTKSKIGGGAKSALQTITVKNGHLDLVVEMKFISADTAIFRDVSFNASLHQLHMLREERASIADYIGIPIVSINQRSIITEYNRKAAELFGYTPGLAIGQNVSILMTPDIAAHHHTYLTAKKGGFSVSTVINNTRDVLAKHRDGSVFCIKMCVKKLSELVPCSPNGGVLSSPRGGGAWSAYFVGSTVTTSASNPNILPKSVASLLRAIKSAFPDNGYMVMNDFGNLLEFSEGCTKILGWQSYDVVGGPVTALMSEGMGKYHQTYVSKYLRRPAGSLSSVIGKKRVVQARTNDDRFISIDINVVDLDSGNKSASTGGQHLFLAIISEAQEELQQSSEAGLTPPTSPRSQRYERLPTCW